MNQTRKITSEIWIREVGDGQATFYAEKHDFYCPIQHLQEQGMLELVDFLLECLEYLHPDHIEVGDLVRFRDGGKTICQVEATDPNFEGAGPAVAVYWPDTHSIEWFNANKLEKISPLHTERITHDRPD